MTMQARGKVALESNEVDDDSCEEIIEDILDDAGWQDVSDLVLEGLEAIMNEDGIDAANEIRADLLTAAEDGDLEECENILYDLGVCDGDDEEENVALEDIEATDIDDTLRVRILVEREE